jgi:copper chaperone CopZ
MLHGAFASVRAAATADDKNVRVVLAIEGMHCTGCASGIKALLKRTPGIISADVSYERREADVTYDRSRISEEKIIEVIGKLGYKASVKKRAEA